MTTGEAPLKAAEKTVPPVTRGDGLAEKLAHDIMTGELAPGARLDEMSMANRYGTSRTPVREAIRQLVTTGLVERWPYRGAVVASPSAERLGEMFAAATEIEANCARLAALAMDADERTGLRQSHEALGKSADGAAAAFREADAAFHEHLYAGAHNAILEGYARELRQRLTPFRRARADGAASQREALAEIAAIVTAVVEGDGDEAAARMRTHMTRLDAPCGLKKPA